MIYNELILTFFKCLFNKNYQKFIPKSELHLTYWKFQNLPEAENTFIFKLTPLLVRYQRLPVII